MSRHLNALRKYPFRKSVNNPLTLCAHALIQLPDYHILRMLCGIALQITTVRTSATRYDLRQNTHPGDATSIGRSAALSGSPATTKPWRDIMRLPNTGRAFPIPSRYETRHCDERQHRCSGRIFWMN